MTEFPKEGERVILSSADDTVELKQLVPEDAARYFDLIEYDRSHLSQFGDVTAEKYPTVESVEQSIVNPANPLKYRFGIWDGDTMVGSNNLTVYADGKTAEVGSWVGKKHIGSHYAARARRLLIDFAFTTLGLDQLESYIEVGNEASRKSVESTGFRLRETFHGKWVYVLDNPNREKTND